MSTTLTAPGSIPALATRPLSRLENIFWRLSNSGSLNFTFVSRLRGPLTESQLRAALDRVQVRHPLLRVRIEVTPAGPAYRADGVGPIPLRVVDAPSSDESVAAECVRPWIEDEINEPVCWQRGPMVRCILIRHRAELHHLLVTFHHLTNDGMSGLILLRDLYSALAEPTGMHNAGAQIPTFIAPAIDDRLPSAARRLRGILAGARFLARRRREERRFGSVELAPKSASAAADSTKTCAIVREFPDDFVVWLAQRARAEKTTVHNALTAAVCLEMAATIGAGRSVSIRHRSPVNLRKELVPVPENELGLFVSMMFYRGRFTGQEDIWETARKLREQLLNNQRRGLLWGALRLMPALYRVLKADQLSDEEFSHRWRANTPTTSGLTNVGRVPLESHYGAVTVENLHVSCSLSSLVDFTSTVLTFDGRMAWTFLCPERVFGPGGADAIPLIDRIVGRVEAAL